MVLFEGLGGLVFVYPGQGSQKAGMAADLLREDPDLFERYMSKADIASGLPISRLCVDGTLDELTDTRVTQPALFAHSLALTERAKQLGLRPDFIAGHSLGEYTAAVAGGAIDIEDGMRLVAQRGRLMAEIQAERPGAMAAVVGLAEQVVIELCNDARSATRGVVSIANLNTPSQTVVSGEVAAVDQFVELARQARGRVLRLAVGAAFHSELMQPVQQHLSAMMDTFAWRDSQVPLAANFSGQLVTGGDDIHHALVAQITLPVQWVRCIGSLIEAGATRFLELGPGRVLSGLIHQISRDAEVSSAGSV